MTPKRTIPAVVSLALLIAAGGCVQLDTQTGETKCPDFASVMGEQGPPSKPKSGDVIPFEATARELIGLTESNAQNCVEQAGLTRRVVYRNGESLAVTLDYRPDRINISVEEGFVVDVTLG